MWLDRPTMAAFKRATMLALCFLGCPQKTLRLKHKAVNVSTERGREWPVAVAFMDTYKKNGDRGSQSHEGSLLENVNVLQRRGNS